VERGSLGFVSLIAIVFAIATHHEPTPSTATPPAPKGAEKVQQEAEFRECWMELQYRAAVQSGKSDAMAAIKSVDMQPIYQRCLLWVGSEPKTDLDKKRWAAERQYWQCTGTKPWKGYPTWEVQSRCMAQVYPTCNVARYDPNTCLIPQPQPTGRL